MLLTFAAARPTIKAVPEYPPPLTVDEHHRLYLAMFDSPAEAEAFERDVLAEPRERLPPEVLAVLDGGPKTGAYYDHLFSELHSTRGLRK